MAQGGPLQRRSNSVRFLADTAPSERAALNSLEGRMTKDDLSADQRTALAQLAKSALIQSCNVGTGSISAWRQPSRCQQGRSAWRLCIRRTANSGQIRRALLHQRRSSRALTPGLAKGQDATLARGEPGAVAPIRTPMINYLSSMIDSFVSAIQRRPQRPRT